MPEKEGFLIIDSQNAAAIGCNYKADEAAVPCPQNMARPKLSDISNLPQNSRPLIQDRKSLPIPTTIKEYIEQLQKENLALAKMLAQRNKIVEQSGIELERLRLNLIKMREQNQHLALSHTLMLAELNSGKDKLKALQHELGCNRGLLQARNSKPEVNLIKEVKASKESEDHKQPCNAKRKARSLCIGSSEQLQSEDNAGNRPPARRQSARFKAVPDGDSLSETGDSKYPENLLPGGTVPSTSADASAKKEDHVAKRRQPARSRLKTVTPCPLPDETFQENGTTSVETLAKNEGHAVQRPSVRRQSIRLKTNRSKQADDLLEIDDTVSHKCSSLDEPAHENGSTSVDTPCPLPDEIVQENGSTAIETSVKNEGHAVQRLSLRRQSISYKAKRPKLADGLLEMDGTVSLKCSSLDAPVLENGSTSVDTLIKNEDKRSSSGREYQSEDPARPSLGRPSRVASKKVQSYKEIPLNVKLRRSQ